MKKIYCYGLSVIALVLSGCCGYFFGSLKFRSARLERIKVYSASLRNEDFNKNRALADFVRVQLYYEYLSGGGGWQEIPVNAIKAIESKEILDDVPLKGGWEADDLYRQFKKKYENDRGQKLRNVDL